MSVRELEHAFRDLQIVELGQYLEQDMPVHPSHSKFFKMPWHAFSNGDVCNDYQILLNEHNGTHVDSFGHYIGKPEFELIDQIPINSLCGSCIAIDATFLKARETLEIEHILKWEEKNGEIKEQDIVLIATGWMQYWATGEEGRRFVENYPGVGASAADYLTRKKIKLIGIDTLSVDAFGAVDDPAHHTFLSNRIPIVENLRNIPMLFGKRGYFLMLPLLIRDGTASPVRPVAFIDES